MSRLQKGHANRFVHVMLAEAMQIFSVVPCVSIDPQTEFDSKPSKVRVVFHSQRSVNVTVNATTVNITVNVTVNVAEMLAGPANPCFHHKRDKA